MALKNSDILINKGRQAVAKSKKKKWWQHNCARVFRVELANAKGLDKLMEEFSRGVGTLGVAYGKDYREQGLVVSEDRSSCYVQNSPTFILFDPRVRLQSGKFCFRTYLCSKQLYCCIGFSTVKKNYQGYTKLDPGFVGIKVGGSACFSYINGKQNRHGPSFGGVSPKDKLVLIDTLIDFDTKTVFFSHVNNNSAEQGPKYKMLKFGKSNIAKKPLVPHLMSGWGGISVFVQYILPSQFDEPIHSKKELKEIEDHLLEVVRNSGKKMIPVSQDPKDEKNSWHDWDKESLG